MCAAPIQPRTNRGHASQSRPGAGSPQSSQRTARTNVRAPEKIRLADENGFATTRVVRTAREFRGPLRFRRASRASDANGYPPSPASLKPSRRFWPKRGQKLQFGSPNPPICPLFGQIGRFGFEVVVIPSVFLSAKSICARSRTAGLGSARVPTRRAWSVGCGSRRGGPAVWPGWVPQSRRLQH